MSITEKKQIDIEEAIRSKNPKILKWIPRFVISYLKRVIHEDGLNEILDNNPDSYNVEFGKICTSTFGVKSTTVGLDELPKDKRYLFVANHPLGGLDGIIFMNEVGSVFPNIKFPVNDLLLKIGRFNDIFIAINKHGAQSRQAAQDIEEAFASDSQMLFFPAGLVSRKQKGGVIADLEWKANFVKKAYKYKRDIVPVYISGKNSNFFYNFARLRKFLGVKINLEMLYLVDEMYKFKDKEVTLTFGKPIDWKTLSLENNSKEIAKKIRQNVYNLVK